MPSHVETIRPCLPDRSPTRAQRHRASGNLPERIATVRGEVFELVGELQRDSATASASELERAGDQMQSIANQLGAIQAAIGDGSVGASRTPRALAV